MRIPQIFIPEKNLEKKVCELVKRSKNQTFKDIPESGYNKLDCRIIYNRAKEVAEKLGQLDIPFAIYNFEDKKTGMVIEYAPHWGHATHLRIDVKDKHSSPIVFESVQYKKSKRQKVLAYIPGGWQDRLEKLYKKTQQK